LNGFTIGEINVWQQITIITELCLAVTTVDSQVNHAAFIVGNKDESDRFVLRWYAAICNSKTAYFLENSYNYQA